MKAYNSRWQFQIERTFDQLWSLLCRGSKETKTFENIYLAQWLPGSKATDFGIYLFPHFNNSLEYNCLTCLGYKSPEVLLG